MDKIDQEILQELTKNGRKPFKTIAKKLGVSTQTIIRRYDEMKTNGTIALLAITVDLEKIGYTGTAHILIKTNPNAQSSQIVKQLCKTQNVITAANTIGTYDAYAVLAFKDISDLYENVFKIKKMPNVLTIDVSVAVPGIQNFPPTVNYF